MASLVDDSNKVDTGGGALLKKSLTVEEYGSIPIPIRNKIETALGDHIEDYLTAKALFESTQVTHETKLLELNEIIEKAVQERDEFKSRVDVLTIQCEETNSRLTSTTAQLSKIRESIARCEKEAEVLRKERDQAVDERQIAVNLVDRKSSEIERLSSDVKVLNDQLTQSVIAKCEALAAAEDVAQRQVELELQEKRIENKSIVLTQQNVDLRSDLARIAEEMTQQRRESTSEVQSLTTKLALKDDELTVLLEQKAQLSQANEELTTRIDKLTEALKEQNESEIKLVDHYQKEVRAHTKMVDLHKNMLEVAESKIGELSGAVRDLQRLLGEATTQYGELETKLSQSEEDHRWELENKQQAIDALKKELVSANKLLSQVKQESTEDAISRLSPLAASTSKLLKSGLTLTQLYCQYAEVSEELINQKQENQKLTDYVNKVHKEIEEKAPILKKQREDYDYSISMVDGLSLKVDDLVKEQTQLRKQSKDSECNMQFLTRENKRYKQSVSDLSRQVCYMLKELEALRGNFIPVHDRTKTKAEITTSSDVIEKHLVTFRDIEELQLNNQKLMAALRELSDEKDAEEMRRESKEVTVLKNDIKQLNSKMVDLEEREQVVLKQVDIVKGQRDVYQRLLMQHAKPGSLTYGSEELSVLDENGGLDEVPQKLSAIPQKAKPETQVSDEGSKYALDELRKTFDAYRSERSTNERMLNETIERLQQEKSEISMDRAKFGSQAEYSMEKCKTLTSTVKSLRAQVQALEQKCSSCLQTTTRLEESHRQLRQEAMAAMKKLSVAEVTAANLKQENQFLKDSEKRLINERNNERKTKVAQEMLMANLESLKAKFECSDAEGRRRLEDRLDDANKELSAVRRKLEEEQERMTKKVQLLEEQTKTSKDRLEEERNLKEKALTELHETREALSSAEEKMNDADNRLGTAISTSQPVIERDNKIKDLEKKICDYETDIKNLDEKLQHSKKSCGEMKEMCEVTEKQLVEITEKYEMLKQESDISISELKKTELELRNSITQLEIRVSTSKAAEAEIAAQREGELASLRGKVTSLIETVNTQRETVEKLESELKEASHSIRVETDKYTVEVVTKAALQQQIDKMVEEVKAAKLAAERAINERSGIEEARKLEVSALQCRLNEIEARAKDGEYKVQEVSRLNDLLHEQIDRLSEQIDSAPNTTHDDAVAQEEAGEGPSKESKVLMDIMQHLRKEKTSAMTMANSLRQDKLHLEAEVEVLKVQIDELRKSLEAERSSSDTPTITVQKHAQLLHQVEVLGQLTESNKNMSEERDKLMKRLAELEASARQIEEEIVSPVKLRASELSSRLETLEVENQILKAESQRWRARSEELIEKCNKTNPEDLKRLTLEKENLTKQLSTEREQFKAAKLKFEQQLDVVQKEKSEVQGESAGLGATLNETRQLLEQSKTQLKEINDKFTLSEKKATQLTSQMEDLKAKEIQIRQIAKKYKTQYMELSQTVEMERKARTELPGPSGTAAQTEKDESAIQESVKQLNDQLVSIRSDLEVVRKENEALQNNSLEKEDRAKNLLKNARSRVVQLTEEKGTLLKELNELRARPKGDAESRISALESRITRLEKEKSDEQSEKERLGSEVEMLTQKLLILQRQLEKQQGSKPSTSCAEKGTNEPPTANIKPMAGTSSSTTKQHQHSATVTPWRETTPFASIRPLSQPTRTTVVVLPTSQTTSPSSQPVMVAPQQSVHTSSNIEAPSPSSSHMDYMPVTSSHSGGTSTGTPAGVTRPERREEEIATPGQPQNNVALVLPQPLQPGRAQATASAAAVQEQQQVSRSETLSSVCLIESEAIENNTVSASNQEPSEPSVSASQPPVLPLYCRQVEEGQGVASSQEVAGGSGTSQLSGASGQPTSSSSSVSTSQGNQGIKRPHPPSSPSTHDHDAKLPPQVKRSRVSGGAEEEIVLHSDGLEVEYQVPTSSQRDQDDPLVISDDEIPDQGAIEDGGEFEEDPEEEGRYGIETYSHNEQELTSFDDAEGPDIDEGSNTDQDNNEVDIIDDSNEVPNQCESSGGGQGGSTEATSSGPVLQRTYQPRRTGPTPASLPLLSRHHSMLISYDEAGDDGIVPSTPTLYVPRRVDGFGEPVSSPHVPSPRFTFGNEPPPQPSQPRQSMGGGVAQVASEGMDDTRMDLSQLDEGRRVPTTPSHVSPQDGGSSGSSTSSSSGSGEIGQSIGPSEDDLQPNQQAEAQPTQQKHEMETSTSSTDGVSSDGEKGRAGLEGVEEEGREAEAGPSAPRGSSRATSQCAKRSARVTARRAPPQPIVWEKPNVSTSAPTPTTQTVSMIPFRGVMRGGRGMTRGGGAPPNEATPGQVGLTVRPPPAFVRGNRARRSSRAPFRFNQQNGF